MDFFGWFQIATLALFYLMFLGRSLQLMSKGINPSTFSGKGWREGLWEALLLVGLAVWTVEAFSHSLSSDFHIFPKLIYKELFQVPILKVVGAILVSTGLVLLILALASLGTSWRIGIDRRNPGRLVTRGIFSLTRNPVFVCLDLYFLGTFLIWGKLFFLVYSLLAISALHLQILREERFLRMRYGGMYEDYARRVGRYFTLGGLLKGRPSNPSSGGP